MQVLTCEKKGAKSQKSALFWNIARKIHGPDFSLKKAVRKSKLKAFKELRDSTDNDIRDKSYSLVMTKVKGSRSAQPTDRKIMKNIVSMLLPPQNAAVIPFISPSTIEEFMPLSEEELLIAANKMNKMVCQMARWSAKCGS